jgi:cytochrome o ubiquinol oxidase subunit 2
MKKMAQHKKSRHSWFLVPFLLGLAALGWVIKTLLEGHNVALFNPKGKIASEQLELMLVSVGVMLIIGIPAIFMFYFFAWKYRETNTKPKREPETKHHKLLVTSIWVAPTIIAIILTLFLWPATHRLEPQKRIAADAKPLTIQVVSLRWKWLFIYPEQKIASVNYVQIPINTPVEFELTGDESPMSSFWIPNLGGMLYAMNGHLNKLNLIADTMGDYPGSSAEINGAGFAGMKFTARVSSDDDFNKWVQEVQLSSGDKLDTATYDELLKPTEYHPVTLYSAVEDDLYGTVLMKYMGAGHDHKPAEYHGGH